VSTAADGVEALAQAQLLLPDLIVLDLELPQLSGVDVAKQLRANPETQDIPLIAATGYSHATQLDCAREAGFDQIVLKPCDPDVLVREIEHLLDSDDSKDGQPGHSAGEPVHNNG
jgi:CheY-like chemotaxis protein